MLPTSGVSIPPPLIFLPINLTSGNRVNHPVFPPDLQLVTPVRCCVGAGMAETEVTLIVCLVRSCVYVILIRKSVTYIIYAKPVRHSRAKCRFANIVTAPSTLPAHPNVFMVMECLQDLVSVDLSMTSPYSVKGVPLEWDILDPQRIQASTHLQVGTCLFLSFHSHFPLFVHSSCIQ